mmetsp:Transcript_13558/g.35140  ORF Transcript_13558/g.35140 Transcript_13558/m.35140 type:complete len:207 (+) Transcript_13558:756-1376(+)
MTLRRRCWPTGRCRDSASGSSSCEIASTPSAAPASGVGSATHWRTPGSARPSSSLTCRVTSGLTSWSGTTSAPPVRAPQAPQRVPPPRQQRRRGGECPSAAAAGPPRCRWRDVAWARTGRPRRRRSREQRGGGRAASAARRPLWRRREPRSKWRSTARPGPRRPRRPGARSKTGAPRSPRPRRPPPRAATTAPWAPREPARPPRTR